MPPSPRQAIGKSRTEAATKALGVSSAGFAANGLVLCTDPLGREADVLTITKDRKVFGELLHCPGMYGEDKGDWHIRIASLITMKAGDLQRRQHWPKGCWRYDAGPFDTPQAAMDQFAAKIGMGLQECPEAFE